MRQISGIARDNKLNMASSPTSSNLPTFQSSHLYFSMATTCYYPLFRSEQSTSAKAPKRYEMWQDLLHLASESGESHAPFEGRRLGIFDVAPIVKSCRLKILEQPPGHKTTALISVKASKLSYDDCAISPFCSSRLPVVLLSKLLVKKRRADPKHITIHTNRSTHKTMLVKRALQSRP